MNEALDVSLGNESLCCLRTQSFPPGVPAGAAVSLGILQLLTKDFQWTTDLQNGQYTVTMQYGGLRIKLEYCLQHVVALCPAETWPQASLEAKEKNWLQNLGLLNVPLLPTTGCGSGI